MSRLLVLPGDGAGPEVVAEAVKVLGAVTERFGLQCSIEYALIGGAAVERTGEPLPGETLHACRSADAVLLGAVGGPRWDGLPADLRPERALLALRKALGLYANLRPVRAFPELVEISPLRGEVVQGTDLLIVRELTGGLYFGDRRRDGDEATDTLPYTRAEVARVARVALQAAQARRGRLASVDKANVLETSRLWREVVTEEARVFPEVEVEHLLVDTCAMRLVRSPRSFDVIVTENMFGDILSDEAAAVVGSLGLLPSASLVERHPFLYEPIHGSAPDIAGTGTVDPIGAIRSVAMMLRHSFAHPDAAAAVEDAVGQAIRRGVRTPDLGGTARTQEVGDAVRSAVGDAPLGVGRDA